MSLAALHTREPRAGPEEPGPEVFSVARAARVRRIPFVRQIDEMDCGAACLAMVCRHFGRAVSLSHVRRAHAHERRRHEPQGPLPRRRSARARGAPRQGARRARSTACRCPRSSTGRATTGRCSTTCARTACASPTPRWASARSTAPPSQSGFTGYAALFDYTRALEDAPDGRGRPRLAPRVRAPAPPPHRARGRALRDGQPPRDELPGLHAAHRRPRHRGRVTSACSARS